jgi:hypothetical protein
MLDFRTLIATIVVSAAVAGGIVTFTSHNPDSVQKEKRVVSAAAEEAPPQPVIVQVIGGNPQQQASAAGSASVPPPVSEPEETQAVTVEDMAVQMEERFRTDAAPTPSSRVSAAKLRTAFTRPDLKGTQLNSIECKSSTCKLELTFADVQSDHEDVAKLLIDPALTMETGMASMIPVRNTRSDGKIDAVAYFFVPEAPPARL